MIRKISKAKILTRLEQLEKNTPSGEPFIVFIEQVDDGLFQVSSQISKGKGKREIETYKVHSLDDFYAANPGIKCPVIIDDLEFSDEDATILFHALIKVVNDAELDELVDLVAKSIKSDGNNTDLNNFMKQLVKKHWKYIMETVGFDTADYERLTTAQLMKLVGDEDEDEDY